MKRKMMEEIVGGKNQVLSLGKAVAHGRDQIIKEFPQVSIGSLSLPLPDNAPEIGY
jgi:hypothetical protein